MHTYLGFDLVFMPICRTNMKKRSKESPQARRRRDEAQKIRKCVVFVFWPYILARVSDCGDSSGHGKIFSSSTTLLQVTRSITGQKTIDRPPELDQSGRINRVGSLLQKRAVGTVFLSVGRLSLYIYSTPKLKRGEKRLEK